MELATNFRLVLRFREHMDLCLHFQRVCLVLNLGTWDSFRFFALMMKILRSAHFMRNLNLNIAFWSSELNIMW
jgi:hypothetical protein